MHFGEYELSPSLISLSPPPSVHPEAFQRLLVRSSSWCYPAFNLTKGRSLGFASVPSDYPPRVIGIFTDTTISLSSRLRQRPDHYTIRAGRNLPDKEFRYLRTVIVTAAVYWGFNSTLLLR